MTNRDLVLNRDTPPLQRAVRRSRRNRVAAGVAILAVSAVVNGQLARRAERRNLPKGRFIQVKGARLHYLERGQGTPLVLLHGNGSMSEDFAASGLIDLAARKYRVIVIDRPGYGHSSRPRGTIWTPETQADAIHEVLHRIGALGGIVLGHSWGASVAVALGLKYADAVGALVLASGYYFPSPRMDVLLASVLAVPVLGDIISHTVSPIAARIMWPMLMRKIFAPAPIPEKFRLFPREMAVRPTQLRTSAVESALMIPDAVAYSADYARLRMPVVIIAGEADRLVDTDSQSARLHGHISQSILHRVPGIGHMIHQSATGAVVDAIDEAANLIHNSAEPRWTDTLSKGERWAAKCTRE